MSVKRRSIFEALERRQLRSVTLPTLINDGDILGDSAVIGSGSAGEYNGDLQIPAGSDTSASAFYSTKQPISDFSTTVEFGPANPPSSNQYLDFVIQNGAPNALGGQGAAAGYGGGTISAHSAAVIINEDGDGTIASMAFATGGVTPTTFTPMPGINLTNSGLYTVAISYDAGHLNFSITNEGDSTNTFSATDAINLPAAVGGQDAYVGFAGSAGDANPNGSEDPFVRNWTYAALEAPNFSAPPAATAIAGGDSVILSAGADISDGSAVTYDWTDLTKPNGAITPTLSNSTAEATLATFKKAGTYHFRVTATDANGETTASDVSVRIAPVGTVLKVTPHAQKFEPGQKVQFAASLVDQFGHALPSQPSFRFAVTSGSGSIDATTGLFSAGAEAGHLIITATTGDLSGFSGETIL